MCSAGFPAALLRPPADRAGVEHVPRLFSVPEKQSSYSLLSEGLMRTAGLLTRVFVE